MAVRRRDDNTPVELSQIPENPSSPPWLLGGETEVDDVRVLDDVLLAFEPDLAVIAAGGHRTPPGQGVIGDHLGADEATLDVAVNLAGGELCRRTARD